MRHAVLSDDGVYRYALWRDIPQELVGDFHCPVTGVETTLNDGSPESTWFTRDDTCLFVMLNPSTADAEIDDPTITRCIGFARRWGFGKLAVGNLYAFRATNPEFLGEAEDPVGPNNDDWLDQLGTEATYIVAAWGANKAVDAERINVVTDLLNWDVPLVCLGLTDQVAPRHPLYVPSKTRPVEFVASGNPGRPA